MRERREIVDIVRKQSLMKCLLLAQRLYAFRAPPWIEFPLLNAISRRKTHQRGANERADEAEASKEEQALERKAEQIRGLFGFAHCAPTQE